LVVEATFVENRVTGCYNRAVTVGSVPEPTNSEAGGAMFNSNILKAIVAIAIIAGGIYVIMIDEPAVPTGDINRIEPRPAQDR
tara:strand:+ start:623 stop:871 length:249 start_codon:yes stop_codon:yes gene_type:complete